MCDLADKLTPSKVINDVEKLAITAVSAKFLEDFIFLEINFPPFFHFLSPLVKLICKKKKNNVMDATCGGLIRFGFFS